ncbi:MAG TPA: DUF4870 domain-containing protein [Puia sp.]|jgi:uncharacterized Tic20 family protein|nr:DUF4870 domain-containing protein [Puia sp.]
MAEEYPLTTPSSDEKTMAILAHALTLVAPILAPLIIWLVKKDESEFVRQNALESLNFQITLTICVIISAILTLIIIGAFLLMIIGIGGFILVIVASIKASEGKIYRYPVNFRLIK